MSEFKGSGGALTAHSDLHSWSLREALQRSFTRESLFRQRSRKVQRGTKFISLRRPDNARKVLLFFSEREGEGEGEGVQLAKFRQ